MFVKNDNLEDLQKTHEKFQNTLDRIENQVAPVPLELNQETMNLVEKRSRGNRFINLENAPTDFLEVWDQIKKICEEHFGEMKSESDLAKRLSSYPDLWKVSAMFVAEDTQHKMNVQYYADGRIDIGFTDAETYRHYSTEREIRKAVEQYCKELDLPSDYATKIHQMVLDYREKGDKHTEIKNDIGSAIYIVAGLENAGDFHRGQERIGKVIKGRRIGVTDKYQDMLETVEYLDISMKNEIIKNGRQGGSNE